MTIIWFSLGFADVLFVDEVWKVYGSFCSPSIQGLQKRGVEARQSH
jgi:hypothetical protein